MTMEALFNALFVGLRDDERIELRCFDPINHKVRLRRWVRTGAEITLIAQQEKNDLYFGVNPRTAIAAAHNSGTNGDVSRIFSVCVDIDLKHVDDPLAALEDYGLAPTATSFSGGGVHAWYALTTPQENTDEFTKERKAFEKIGASDHVADAARVLRVIGTYNTKPEFGSPREVQLLESDAQVRYLPSVFAKMPHLRKELRHRLATGDSTGFTSRSERDFSIITVMVLKEFTDEEIYNIFWHCVGGDRYRGDWPRLIDIDIAKARAGIGKPDPDATTDATSGEIFAEFGPTLWNIYGEGKHKVATFTFEPEALLTDPEDGAVSILQGDILMGKVVAESTDEVWEDVHLPKNAFIDRRSFSKKLTHAEWSWEGTDRETVLYLPYLVRKLQQNHAPRLTAVPTLGRYSDVWMTQDYVVTGAGIQTFKESLYAYVDRRQEKPEVDYTPLSQDDVAPTMKRLFYLLSRVNEPAKMWLMFSWIMASFYKPLLGARGTEFPILEVIGSRGSGKTSMIKKVFMPLCGHVNPNEFNCDGTEFSLLALMSSNTSIPVYMAEYRDSLDNREKIIRRLRLSYDAGFDIRGNQDKSTTRYQLSSPLIIDGENKIDDAAIVERAVLVTLSQASLEEEGRRDAFAELATLPLHDVSGYLVQWTLNHPPPMERAKNLVTRHVHKKMPDRVLKNLIVVATGYETLQLIDAELGCPRIPVSIEEMTEDWLDEAVQGNTGRTLTLADQFIQDIINAVSRAGMGTRPVGSGVAGEEPFFWRYDGGLEDELSFQLATALDWWSFERRRRGLSAMSTSTAKAQLKERSLNVGQPGQYICKMGTMVAAVGQCHMYTVCLSIARSTGLDIPSAMNMLRLSNPQRGGSLS